MPAAFLTPALSKLRNEIDEMAPNRSTASDGWIGDPAHASRHSDHNPEADGSVDAIDVTHDPGNGADCFKIREQIKHDPRLVGGGYIIFNNEIYNPDISDSWRQYTGSNEHRVHMHVSVSDRLQTNTLTWFKNTGGYFMGAEEKLDELITVTRNGNKAIVKQHQLDRRAALKRELREARRDNKNTTDIVQAIDEIDNEIRAGGE